MIKAGVFWGGREIFIEIAESVPHHGNSSYWYRMMTTNQYASARSSYLAAIERGGEIDLLGVTSITVPDVSFGDIKAIDLLGLDELILLAFYSAARNRYQHFLDLGANIGLHSLYAQRLGWQVVSVEPDPIHVQMMADFFAINDETPHNLLRAAVSHQAGVASFTRVSGNSTGSHLSGLKSPYGPVETFEVDCIRIDGLIQRNQLIKMDIEGAEASVVESMRAESFNLCDMILEIGSHDNARRILNFVTNNNLCCLTQKTGWKAAKNLDEMPWHYSEGSALICQQPDLFHEVMSAATQ